MTCPALVATQPDPASTARYPPGSVTRRTRNPCLLIDRSGRRRRHDRRDPFSFSSNSWLLSVFKRTDSGHKFGRFQVGDLAVVQAFGQQYGGIGAFAEVVIGGCRTGCNRMSRGCRSDFPIPDNRLSLTARSGPSCRSSHPSNRTSPARNPALDKILRVNTSDDNWREKVQELLIAYASSLRILNNEAVIAIHRENVRLQAVELCEVTRRELDWR